MERKEFLIVGIQLWDPFPGVSGDEWRKLVERAQEMMDRALEQAPDMDREALWAVKQGIRDEILRDHPHAEDVPGSPSWNRRMKERESLGLS